MTIASDQISIGSISPGHIDTSIMDRVLIHGDLKPLSPQQKVSYYKAVCESVGLNPLTQPFQYLTIKESGKEVLYARRDATEQLRKIHQVSIQITAREVMEDCYIVTARATLPSGRQDENIGAVPIGGLKGETRANAMMKAETKAKRRVTLAICGLGMLDETEVASIQETKGQSYSIDAPAEASPAAASDRETIVNPEALNMPEQIAADQKENTHGATLIRMVDGPNGRAKGFLHPWASQPGDNGYAIYNNQLMGLASECYQERVPVVLTLKTSPSSGKTYVSDIKRLSTITKPSAPVSAGEIAF